MGSFTTLQVLFLSLLYSPPLIGFLGLIALAEIGEFFMTAGLWEFIGVGFLMYLFALALPFASLLWVMVIKLFMGGHMYKNKVTPGVYPKWSRMHLRTWCIGRLERSVLLPLRTMFRSAPLMAYVLRRLGTTVGDNLQCAHDVEFTGPLDLLSIEDDVAIQTGAYMHMSRWLGQDLHIGPVHLESGCKIGMRAAIANNVTVGRGTWITPLTPILSDVGSEEMWEGAPARFSGRCTQLQRTANTCEVSAPVLGHGDSQHPHECLPGLLADSSPHRRGQLDRRQLHTRQRNRNRQRILQSDAAARDCLAHGPLRLHHHLGRHRSHLSAGLPLSSLHARLARTVFPRADSRALSSCTD